MVPRAEHPQAVFDRHAARDRARIPTLLSSALLAVGALWTPSDTVIVCPLRLVSGLPCPTCGLTHSVCATLHGDLHTVPAFNLLGPVVVVVAILILGASLAQLAGHPWLDRIARLGVPAFYLGLAFEVIFVWPPHLAAALAPGWREAVSHGLVGRVLSNLQGVFHGV